MQDGVTFVFGIDAMTALYTRVEELAGRRLEKARIAPRYEVKTKCRARPQNIKQQVVEQREFEDIRLVTEYVAEFYYSPTQCRNTVSCRGCVERSRGVSRPREALR